MRRHHLKMIALPILCCALLTGCEQKSDDDPGARRPTLTLDYVHGGKSMREWSSQLGSANYQLVSEATDAFRAMGAKGEAAIPLIEQAVATHASHDFKTLAARALVAIGEPAKPAIDRLLDHQTWFWNALKAIEDEGQAAAYAGNLVERYLAMGADRDDKPGWQLENVFGEVGSPAVKELERHAKAGSKPARELLVKLAGNKYDKAAKPAQEALARLDS